MPPRKRLGQLLTELGVVDEHQLQSALGHQKQWGGKLGAILVQKGFCKEPDLIAALSKHLAMPSVRLEGQAVDPRALKYVSRQIAEKLHLFAYEVTGSGRSEVITVAMSDPTDLSAIDQLAFHTGKRVKPLLSGDSEIAKAIQVHYGGGEAPKPAEPAPAAQPASPAPATPQAAAPAITPFPPGFPRLVDPGAAQARPAGPYIPPPARANAPVPESQLEEIEPAEDLPESPMAPPAGVPLEVPEGGEAEMPLEPIAAHSQGETAVAGDEEVAGRGGASDAVEGFESAGGAGTWSAPAASGETGWDAPAPEGATGWDMPEAAPEPAPSAEAAPASDAWGQGAAWAVPPAEDAATGEHLPTGAILGVAESEASAGWAEPSAEPAPEQATGWSEPAAAESQAAESAAAPASWSEGAHEGWSAAAESGEAAPPPAWSEPAETSPAPAETAAPDWSEAGEAEPAAPAWSAEAAAPEETEAPEAWGASEDPLAGGEAAGEAAGEELPAHDRTDRFVAGGFEEPSAHPEETQRFAFAQPPSSSGPQETSGFAEAAPEPTPAASSELSGGQEGEEEFEVEQPDFEERPAAQGLVAGISDADAGTLASIGVDPSDAPGALRALAALVRVLHRRQLLDLEELAAEVRESHAQEEAGAGAHQ